MLNAEDALRSLVHALDDSLGTFAIGTTRFGHTDLLKQTALEIAQATRGSPVGRPPSQTAYMSALHFLRGQDLDEQDRDRLAWALCTPISEQDGGIAIGAGSRFAALIEHYRAAAAHGDLWRVTWLGLFSSYLAFDSQNADEDARAGWNRLRCFLEQSWPGIDTGGGFVPDWVAVLRDEPALLSPNPCNAFASDYLRGNTLTVDRFERELGIPQASWFWRELVMAAVKRATHETDDGFKATIDRILQLIRARPASRDRAIQLILERYARCEDRSVHARLRDFVIDRRVWKNPKLKPAGLAPAWERVSDDVWRMVSGWVSQANLQLFFEVLVRRNGTDEGRHEFWLAYLGQISSIKLALGGETVKLAQRDSELAKALALEEGGYAYLESRWSAIDAMLIEIGNYLIVEFSVAGNTCYGYPLDNLPFARNAVALTGGTSDLKAGYFYRGESRDIRIDHGPNWREQMAAHLARIGIQPDRARGNSLALPAPGLRGLAPTKPISADRWQKLFAPPATVHRPSAGSDSR
jgi:EH_Signature domain